MSNLHLEQEKALSRVKKDIVLAIERLGLNQFVSLEEIEQELSQSKTAFQSLLILGIMRRILSKEDDETAKLFVPAITEWKNYLAHEDLGGLTPFEHREKYPSGEYEMRFIAELMEEYQARLQFLGGKTQETEVFDVEKDFNSFQKEYLKRVPAEQQSEFGKFKNLKEIIIEERRRNGHLEKNIDKVGAQIFAENTAEGIGKRVAEIEDNYYTIVKELSVLQTEQSQDSEERIKEIDLFFKKFEPYFRCALEPHRFYLNYASVLLLGDKIEQCLEALNKALDYKPDYEQAQKMKARVLKFVGVL